jgi:hypothetical protein
MQALLANQAVESYPTNGLVSYWSMRTSGTTVYDEWGSNDGLAVNAPTFSAANGVRDNGAGFVAASSQYIGMGYVAALAFETNQAFSASLWIRHTGSTFSAWLGTAQDENPPRKGWRMSGGGSSIGCRVAINGSTDGIDGILVDYETIPDAGTWTHYAATYSGSGKASGVKIYRDGVQVPVTVSRDNLSGPSTDATPFEIGRRANTTSRLYHDGSMDEVAVWSRALSSNEVYRIATTPLYYP